MKLLLPQMVRMGADGVNARLGEQEALPGRAGLSGRGVTLVFRKIDGRGLIEHEHISWFVNCGSAAGDLPVLDGDAEKNRGDA